MSLGGGRSGGIFGGFLDDEPSLPPLPSRRPPHVWGSLRVEGDDVVVHLQGWRAALAVKRRLTIPLSAVVRVSHDPLARSNVRAKLRRRAGRSGLFRVGAYHSLQGWSFWSIGLGRNAVVVEASGARYRFLVIEVADPAATVAELRRAAGLDGRPDPAASDGLPPPEPWHDQAQGNAALPDPPWQQ